MFYLQCAVLYWYMVVFRFLRAECPGRNLGFEAPHVRNFSRKAKLFEILEEKKAYRVGALATNFLHLCGQHAFMPTMYSLTSFQCIVIGDWWTLVKF